MANKGKKYGLWLEEDMEKAIASYKNGDMGLNAVCRSYGVPKKTLKRRCEGTNNFATEAKKIFGRPQDLPLELEKELVQHILELESRFFGLSRVDVKALAYELAEANCIPHRFNKKSKTAGDKWYYAFLSRHPQLSLRKPEGTSMARATGFTKERVDAFFDVLTQIVDDNKLQAADIFNVDETALSTVQKPRKILAQKGKHQVGSVTSGERGTTTTGIFCMSAVGVYVPPMLVFKGLRFKPEWKIGAPPGTSFALSESGWSNGDVFLKWFEHFVAFIKPSKDKKVLLILDGHTSHTKNLNVINYAKQNGVVMLALPPHTSHKLQPLDTSFFAPLKSNFNLACDKYIRTNLTKITVSHISLLLNESFPKTAVVATAINGFKGTGIWPVDRDVFSVSDFAIGLPSNVPVCSSGSAKAAEYENPVIHSTSRPKGHANNINKDQKNLLFDCSPSTSRQEVSEITDKSNSPNVWKSVKELSPIPDVNKMKKRNKNSTAIVEILTSSPYKNKLLMKQKQSEEKLKKKELKHIVQKKPYKNKPSVVRKKILFEASSKQQKKIGCERNLKNLQASWFCKICEVAKEEDMIQCLKCFDWFHVVCAGVKPSKKVFYCISCKG